jgi:hypothetical protein
MKGEDEEYPQLAEISAWWVPKGTQLLTTLFGPNDYEIEDYDKPEDTDPKSDDDSDQSEGPEQRGTGKYQQKRTPGNKLMMKMSVYVCILLKRDANVIIVYFIMSKDTTPVDFQHVHWRDTLSYWQKCHLKWWFFTNLTGLYQ